MIDYIIDSQTVSVNCTFDENLFAPSSIFLWTKNKFQSKKQPIAVLYSKHMERNYFIMFLSSKGALFEGVAIAKSLQAHPIYTNLY